MNNVSHKTAMSRKGPSYLAKIAMELETSLEFRSVLDWGCGKGYDVDFYRSQGLLARGWDPYYQPVKPSSVTKFDLVTCSYVMNVIPDREDRVISLREAKTQMRRRGHILVCARSKSQVNYFAQRSNWKAEGDGYLTGSGTFQVGLTTWDLQLLLEDAGFKFLKAVKDGSTVWAHGQKK